jgi:hypothetical protein
VPAASALSGRMNCDLSHPPIVYDPEILADIYEIGLIYRIDIADDRTVKDFCDDVLKQYAEWKQSFH